MPIIETHKMEPSIAHAPEGQQIYNGLDCCLTFEVFEAVSKLTNEEPQIYKFERALQAPILEIMLRGWKVDEYERQLNIKLLRERITAINSCLQEFAFAVWGKELNPRSPKQLQDFFYGTMKLPEQWTSKKGVKKLSTDRETLEKLDLYFHARPIIACILAIRENSKKLEVFETEVSSDGRFRTSYNIAGTETGRLSSSAAADWTGRNLQNIEDELRKMFIADDGWKLCHIDLEQAESRETGFTLGKLFDDWTYLDACEGGDLHTTTCKLIWPSLGWTGDPVSDRQLADQIFYRHWSYRDMSKRGGHGCLTPEHEVLTRTGWVRITDKPLEIMVWENENYSHFDTVSNWTDHLYTGELQVYDGNSLSAQMTHDHRVPFCKDQRYPVIERPAEAGPYGYIPLGSGYTGGTEIVPARLIAAFMADGHQKSTNTMEFHFHKERKFQRLVHLCEQYGFWYELKPDQNKMTVKGTLPKKAGAFMFNWTRQCLLDFVRELEYWDGTSRAAGGFAISSIDREQLEWFQTFGRILGFGGNISGPRTSGYGSTVYRLQQNNRKYATARSIQWGKLSVQNQRVLCPTVPSGWFYIRHNGKISVTGNTTYYGTPFTMARHLKVPTKLMEDFQRAFFEAYTAIPKWHRWVAQELQQHQYLETLFGRGRHFFGRPNDDTTLREAIAFGPQGSTADRMNLGMWRTWKYMPEVQLLAQGHDAIDFQYRPKDEAEIIPQALKLIEVELEHKGRKFIVPGEAKVGWNWSSYHEKKNPNGLMKYKGSDTRERINGLNRVM